jgi:hypothetical protein
VQVPMVVEELVACDAEVQEALADTLEAVQKIAQAGPKAFHRVAVHTRTVRVTTSILARTMVDRPMIIVGLGAMVDVIFIGEELRPAFHLGGDDGFDRRAAPSPAGVDAPSRRWRDRVAESRVVSVRVRGVRLHAPALYCPRSGSTHPLPLGAPVGVSGPDGTSRRCPHPVN